MNENINTILDTVSKLYQFHIHRGDFNKLGNSNNIIYEFRNDRNNFILRITQKDVKYLESYEAELEFVNYLAENGVGVSKAIPSVNNRIAEVVDCEGFNYMISIFEKANGKAPKMNEQKEWNNMLFFIWGKTMGKIHKLSKDYEPRNTQIERKQWNEDIYFTSEYDILKKDDNVYKIFTEIIDELSILPKDKESYGLIHYYFHQYNFFIDNGNLTAFDFDDCLYHWFVCDIAIAFHHALQCIPEAETQKRIKFAEYFIDAFLKGYLEENKIDRCWVERIPLFLEYRRICSYIFFVKSWTGSDLEQWQQNYLKRMKHKIENKEPCIVIDFKSICTKVCIY